MKHLELHIIQSVPVACLNRDDLNSPKTAVFGGVQRARVSSQSWKRAIREMAKETDATVFNGNRSKRMVFVLKNRLQDKGIEEQAAIAIAEKVADVLETLDSKTDADGCKKIKTLLFISEAEYDALADAIASSEEVKNSIDALVSALQNTDSKKGEKEKEKAMKLMEKAFSKSSLAKAIKSVQLKDAADIALFGRMVANDHTLAVEAAAMFSHALSTHKADNEIDFFSAVDDLQSTMDSGAGMTSTLEFNSATYYRFAALNLDMLTDSDHLSCMSVAERQSVVRNFVESTIKAIPGARKNTMNGNTLPVYVLGVVREKGHPIQLINAFENPIRTNQGYSSKSVELLQAEYTKLKDTWGIEAVFEMAIPDVTMKEFLDGVEQHVI